MAARLNIRGSRLGLVTMLLFFSTLLPALYLTLPASADSELDNRSLQLQNDSPGISTAYTFSFTINTVAPIGSIDVLFCSNSPLQNDSCTPPAGMDVTHAAITAASGLTSFTLFPVATNELLVSQSPAASPPLTVTMTFGDITSPAASGSYYARLSAYSSADGTGPSVAFGGLAFAITNNLQISSVVPPYLTFCAGLTINGFDCTSASGDYINFGDLSDSHSSQGESQMLVATNAPNGYVIQVTGTTMTSGNNIINALTTDTPSQPGTSQFGINLRANTTPGVGADPSGPGNGQPVGGYDIPNQFEFNSNDTLVSSNTADNFRKYTVSYLVNVNHAQEPGVYVSTLTYVCAGSF